MLAWINELTDMPDWQSKIYDPEFVSKWKSVKMLTAPDMIRSLADWVSCK